MQRICSDKGNLSDRLFCNKWNSFLDMVKPRGGNDTQRNVVVCGAHRFFMANTQTFMVHTDFLWLMHRLLWCTQIFYGAFEVISGHILP